MTSFDLSKRANIQNRCLARLGLECKGAKFWAIESEASSIPQHEA